eukprot:TRINITY_DN6077_c0_g4_i6.p1 TRINITY_DN6077_c0_g4~~TRINITY_DN6077_c0_g4_i6.p1  ORF type:complete len:525 (-),score=118.49 TRINITY_DN6077_c0_g4_i6:156-1730(-)
MGCGASSTPVTETDPSTPKKTPGQRSRVNVTPAVDVRRNRAAPADKPARSAEASRTEPNTLDWTAGDPEKWRFIETVYDGTYSYTRKPQFQEEQGTIEQGKAKLMSDPAAYQSVWFQTSMETWPEDQQKYTLVKREAKTNMLVTPAPDGQFTHLRAKYEALPPHVQHVPDEVTDPILNRKGYEGRSLPVAKLPGRGQGCADVPTLNVMKHIDPCDVEQGAVGDCWLLSAISSLAEYEGAIAQLFRRTGDIHALPSHDPNQYTVTLWDLPTGKPVDVVVDESLCSRADADGLLGASPSISGDLWVCYLEKAVAVHCGGWDKINGGQCTHAWRLLTGCQDQYTIRRTQGGVWKSFGALNPNTNEMEALANSPHEGFQGLWPMTWPEEGGGGEMNLEVTENDLFERMCAWDDAGFVMGAGTRAGSDTEDHEGIVDGHAYTILDCVNDVADTEFDLIKVRNPWGRGEFKSGKWDDDGPGWTEFPQVKAALNPVAIDDGIFWLEKSEFFAFFGTVYLCAKDMSSFVGTQ